MIERTDNPAADARWSCTRKKAYPDMRMAARVAARSNEERGTDLVPYACTRCGRYHLGRRPAAG